MSRRELKAGGFRPSNFERSRTLAEAYCSAPDPAARRADVRMNRRVPVAKCPSGDSHVACSPTTAIAPQRFSRYGADPLSRVNAFCGESFVRNDGRGNSRELFFARIAVD